MKRATFSVLTLIVLAGLVGCAHHRHLPASCVASDSTAAPEGCRVQGQQGCCAADATGRCNPASQSCQTREGDPGDGSAAPAKKHCRLAGLCHKQPKEPAEQPAEQPAAEAGPPTGAVTYPYYTVRGPRDFLAKNPGSIGP